MLGQSLTAMLFLGITTAAIDRAAAQSASLLVSPLVSPGSGAAGGTVTLNVSLATDGTSSAAVQWDILYSLPETSQMKSHIGFESGGAEVLCNRGGSDARRQAGDLRLAVIRGRCMYGVLIARSLLVASWRINSLPVTSGSRLQAPSSPPYSSITYKPSYDRFSSVNTQNRPLMIT